MEIFTHIMTGVWLILSIFVAILLFDNSLYLVKISIVSRILLTLAICFSVFVSIYIGIVLAIVTIVIAVINYRSIKLEKYKQYLSWGSIISCVVIIALIVIGCFTFPSTIVTNVQGVGHINSDTEYVRIFDVVEGNKVETQKLKFANIEIIVDEVPRLETETESQKWYGGCTIDNSKYTLYITQEMYNSL